MKDSAWYHKLWRKKADEFPAPGDANASWAEMHLLLDKHIPVHKPSVGSKPVKTLGGKIISALGFVLPAAAMIGVVGYIATHHLKNKPAHQQPVIIKKTIDSIVADSLHPQDQGTSQIFSNQILSQALTESQVNSNTANQSVKAANLQQPGVGQSITSYKAYASQSNRRSGTLVSGPVVSYNYLPIIAASPAKVPFLESSVSANFIAMDIAGSNAVPANPWASTNTGEVAAQAMAAALKNYTEGRDLTEQGGIIVNQKKDKKALREEKRRLKEHQRLKDKQDKLAYKIQDVKKDIADKSGYSFNYELWEALNAGKGGSNPVLGINGIYVIQPKWLISTGVSLDLNRIVSGVYSHASFYPRDTLTKIKITDGRKMQVLTIPLSVEYQLSTIVSINMGTQLSFSSKPKRIIKSDGIKSLVGTIRDFRDTLNYSHAIDTALNLSTLNRVNVGIAGGVSVHLNHFYIDGRFLQNITPYKFSNSYLGNTNLYYRSFQIGLRYRFKK